MASIRKWLPLLALLLIVGGCPTVDITPDPPPAEDPPADPPADPDPPPAPEPPPPPAPPPGGDGPTFDPGFNPSTNLIEFFFDANLSDAANGDLLEAELESLQAGDLLRIHAGSYVINGKLSVSAPGTEADPITIEAAEGEDVAITRDNESQNTFNLDGGQYLTIRGLEIHGGSSGFKIGTGGFDYLYFVGNEVHHTGESAIAANSSDTSYLYFVDNHVHDVGGHGEGFYLGANYAASVTRYTYVAGNYIHDTAGTQGDGIEIKTGSYGVSIFENVVEDARYPGILVYGNGGQADRNIIERNILVNCTEAGIQVASDAIIRNNLIIGSDVACILSQSHQGATPSNLAIVHNTLVNSGRCLRASSWNGSDIVFANNALYSSTGDHTSGTGSATLAGNVELNSLGAFVDVNLSGTGRDATPGSGSALLGAGSSTYVTEYDLNGQTRSGPVDAGAVDGD